MRFTLREQRGITLERKEKGRSSKKEVAGGRRSNAETKNGVDSFPGPLSSYKKLGDLIIK